jgi:hypothetical protein
VEQQKIKNGKLDDGAGPNFAKNAGPRTATPRNRRPGASYRMADIATN